jgi:hypothetical protein
MVRAGARCARVGELAGKREFAKRLLTDRSCLFAQIAAATPRDYVVTPREMAMFGPPIVLNPTTEIVAGMERGASSLSREARMRPGHALPTRVLVLILLSPSPLPMPLLLGVRRALTPQFVSAGKEAVMDVPQFQPPPRINMNPLYALLGLVAALCIATLALTAVSARTAGHDTDKRPRARTHAPRRVFLSTSNAPSMELNRS